MPPLICVRYEEVWECPSLGHADAMRPVSVGRHLHLTPTPAHHESAIRHADGV